MLFRHIPLFPSTVGVPNGSCLLWFITYTGGIGHSTQHITMTIRPRLIIIIITLITNPCLNVRNTQLKTQWVLSATVRSRSAL